MLSNDTDANGDALRITRVGTPNHGTATTNGTTITYTPAAGYVGADQFDYAISDGKGRRRLGAGPDDGERLGPGLPTCCRTWS